MDERITTTDIHFSFFLCLCITQATSYLTAPRRGAKSVDRGRREGGREGG